MKDADKNMGNKKMSYLWLCIAGVLLGFANGHWVVPAAAWLAPAFMLRFLHLQKPVRGLIIGLIVYFTAVSIAFYGVMLIPSFVLFLVMIGVASIISFIPFIADRLVAPRLEGFLSTLVFPVMVTALEYAGSFNPNSGSWGSLAYTQWPNLPLIQIASVTGILGISFLVTWFSSTLAWAWSMGFSWDRVRKGIYIYAGVMVMVLLFGGFRLAFHQYNGKPVMVAGVTSQHIIKPGFMEWLRSSQCPPIERSIKELQEKTGNAALTGAKIIVWSEYTALIAKQEEARYVQCGQDLARKHGVYLLMSAGVMGDSKKVESDNMAVMISPEGKVLWRYCKSYLVPGVESYYMVPGKRNIPIVATPYGNIAAVICFDLDFPAYIRSAAHLGADIILVPSYDWREISPFHTYMAGFRAIENGFTVFRVTGNGYTAAIDESGRVIAGMDYFTTGRYIMSAEIPAQRTLTLYSLAGNWFGWLCIAAIVPLVFVAVRKRQK